MQLSDANSAWAIAWSGSIWISSKDKITSNAISDKTEHFRKCTVRIKTNNKRLKVYKYSKFK